MGIISFACKIGIMAYAINWVLDHNKDKCPKSSGRATPVFNVSVPDKSSSTAPIIYASELQNGRVGLEIDLPGLSRDDLSMSVQGTENVILLRGTKPANEKTGEKQRDFSIKIVLPDTANMNDIHAKMENGVLKLDVGKQAFEGSQIHIE
ncbi:hypothetical protein BCR33DRAFT_851828 [Rhizoclosmatium globosum]|uniref:SHSP domain-containing protein n=1 Tax=Rhizoclosmatium globosum TaxID=329046 RepID=A0A1Y2B9L6_9FUNG|nr:hypothetical protein BCR33DRAFT_551105 [Rhizoclosmatium globosum]ORY42331.1 hypothetical protein BCR33DRAFT_851828 [Rhizoclosmatium globosum]|eukprot:ORY31190.1 hypothetical protein BCR33DRAFT_551105 [Rhizoclosmatium globosum]